MDDFIYYKQGDKIMSGGMCIDSVLLKNNIQPLHQLQSGGSKTKLAVPVGLLCLLNSGECVLNTDVYKNKKQNFDYPSVSNDIYEDLLKTYIDSAGQINYKSSKTRRKKPKQNTKTLKNKK